MQFLLTKAHGSGNDFFVVDLRSQLPVTDAWRRALTQQLCVREGLFGADGLLFVEPSAQADAQMRIFNADGSEAEMCGNGIRIVGRYVAESLGKEEVVIENVTGTLYPLRREPGFFPGVEAYRLSFPAPSFPLEGRILGQVADELHQTPVAGFTSPRPYTAAFLPNPHLVALVPAIEEAELAEAGRVANTDKAVFPQGINVNFLQSLAPDSVYVATYERGVGLTNACGTGMFASVVAGSQEGVVPLETWVTVYNPGGFTRCYIRPDLSGYMIGNATYEYALAVSVEADGHATQAERTQVYTAETEAYAALRAEALAALGKTA